MFLLPFLLTEGSPEGQTFWLDGIVCLISTLWSLQRIKEHQYQACSKSTVKQSKSVSLQHCHF